MTDEEYGEIISKVNSEDLTERLQAQILLSVFPTKETKYKYSEVGDVQSKISEVLKKEFVNE